LGDLLREIPTAPGRRSDLEEPTCSAAQRLDKPKTKAEIITGLGFSGDQAKRFETLAENKDLIEHVKQEAHENDDLPTRSRVLNLARERNRRGQGDETEYYDYLSECKKIALKYNNAIGSVSVLHADQDDFQKWAELLCEEVCVSSLQRTERALENLTRIRHFLRRKLT